MRSNLFALCLLPHLLFATTGYHLPWGNDADVQLATPPSSTASSHSFGVQVAEKVIHFHQTVLSPVDGPRSHFRPSSSAYMKQAMQKHGFCQGFIMGCDRLMRENSDPWVYKTIEDEGKLFKYDPVP
jgi:putative component of membrane protein insertase Oxa1/YidC/SpoIIIJ protein YidD